jgi:SsrA-binding protein
MGETLANNRKAFHDYEIIDRYEAGIELIGSEVKAIRMGRVNLKDSYIRIINNEAWLMGVHVTHLSTANPHFKPEEKRVRRLLMHKKELIKLHNKTVLDGMTLVPLSLYTNSKNLVKVSVGLAKGKQLHDKRETLKKKTQLREAAQEMKKY